MNRRFDAVIFDLFGTLVDNVTDAVYHTCLRETAELLGIPYVAFIACWVEEPFRHQRRVGNRPSTAAQIEYICRRFDITPTAEMVEDAVQLQRERFGLGSLSPRPGTLETLAELTAQGYQLGLLSDCSWEVPDVWEQTAFAGRFHATVFSCAAGARKPHPRLYQLISDELGVSPTRCLYVGDGSSRELTGARQAGMTAILLCASHEREIVMQQEDPRQWDGPVIEQVEQVLDYLDSERGAMVHDELQFLTPTVDLEAEYRAFVAEFVAREEPAMYYRLPDGDFAEFVAQLEREARGEGLPDWAVPQNVYWAVCGGRLVGVLKLRHRLTPALETYGGNIGYFVRPSARGQGHATRMLMLALGRARALGLTRVLLTCDIDNLASARVMVKNGGVRTTDGANPDTGQRIARYWITL